MKEKIKPIQISETDTLTELAQGNTLLTSTPALAADWKRRYANAHHRLACESPQVYAWSVWLSELSKSCFDKVYFTPSQELHLWKQAIQASQYSIPQSSIQGLAQQAMQAYALMKTYHIPTHALQTHANDETRALLAWIKALQQILTQKKYQHYALIADKVENILGQLDSLQLPQKIILDGFEDYTPAQQTILNHLKSLGVPLYLVQHATHNTEITLTACQDDAQECEHIVQQVTMILNQNPQARIAICTHTPASNMLKHALQQLLPHHALLPHHEQQAITMPQESLAESPMVQQALHLLGLVSSYKIEWDDISLLLLCPWLRGFEQERSARAQLDAIFRSQNRHRVSFRGLIQSKSVQEIPRLHTILQQLHAWQTSKPKQQSMAEWIKSAQQLLQHLGFMQAGLEHESIRSDDEIQQMNALQEAMGSLIAMDVVQPQWRWEEFLAQLHTACRKSMLNKSALFPNVQLLHMEQAIGLAFDDVIVCGMHDRNFPPAIAPQPLLPLRIQQDFKLPASHASQVFEHCQWLWNNLQQNTRHIHVSYAMQSDGQPAQPSSWIAHLTAQSPLLKPTQSQSWELEDFDDNALIPCQKHEKIRGGTSILKHQSACPFRAFAIHRLRMDVLGETSAGIEPSTQGSLIHLALEYIWKKLLTQQALLQLNHAQQEKLIEQAIQYAWEHSRHGLDNDTQDIECKRMHKVLQQWLNIEKERPPFQVEALEKTYQLSLPRHADKALPITLKIDRIDQDAQGHRIVLDYKTGKKQSAKDWLGERIAEPQLPIYALAAEVGMDDAVGFATVRSGDDMGFEGLSGENLGIKGFATCDGKNKRPDDWAAVFSHWQDNIDLLATEFIQGRSDVAPRDKQACQYCHMEAVCRIDELQRDEGIS